MLMIRSRLNPTTDSRLKPTSRGPAKTYRTCKIDIAPPEKAATFKPLYKKVKLLLEPAELPNKKIKRNES